MADIRVKDLTEASVPGADYYLLTDSATDGVKKVKTTNVVKPADIGAVALNGALGTPTSGDATNLTGTAAGLTAGNVTTNANLTGDVTSVGNAATIAANAVTNAKLAAAADGTIKSNISGASAAPSDNTISAVLDKLLGTTQGNIAYRGATAWGALAPGTAGQVLSTGGAAANPSWVAAGTGDMLAANYFPSVKGYGAVGNGTTADDAAINNAIAASNFVLFPSGTYRITATTTWVAGKTYQFLPGASLTVDTGVTLTVRGVVKAGFTQIFSGLGTVIGVKKVYPEWFGAVRNGSTDDATAINRAIASVQGAGTSDGAEFALTFLPGTYKIASAITFTPTNTIAWRIRGAGSVGNFNTTILCSSAFTGTIGLNIAGSSGSTGIADWHLSGVSVLNQTAGSGATAGIQIGTDATNTLNGYKQSSVEDVVVFGFSKNWIITNTRLVKFDRIASWPSDSAGTETTSTTGIYITVSGASGFTGDLDFVNSQVVAPEGSSSPSGNGVLLYTASGASATISGVGFTNFIFYGGQIQLSLQAASGTISDIFVNPRCQFEAPTRGTVQTNAINIGASGANSTVQDIHISGIYMSGAGHYKGIVGAATTSGVLRFLFVNDSIIANSVKESIDLRNTASQLYGLQVNGNEFHDSANSGGNVVYFEIASHVNVNGNMLTGSSGGISSLILFNAGGNWFVAQGNNTCGLATTSVTDSVGAVNKSITGNI